MKLIVPEYFKAFRCKGGSCSDNCCIGGEIDIDEKTQEKYAALKTPLGERIKKNTAKEEGVCHFILLGERCPFLNSQNLCDIIIEKGEDYLCDICREHPRYYLTLGERVFGGVGLACEEAARLILENPLPHAYAELKTEAEYEECDEELLALFLDLRKEILKIFASKKQTLVYTVEMLKKSVLKAQRAADGTPETPCEIKDFSRDDLISVVEKLELLTPEMPTLLKKSPCPKNQTPKSENTNKYLHNLLLYFLDRYLPKAVEDGDFISKLNFALFSFSAIEQLFSAEEDLTLERAVYLSKLYSKEVEYNEDNIYIITNA